MNRYYFILFFAFVSTLSTFAQSKKSANPPAQGFDLAGSDPKAVQLADQVMQAMGGRNAWDKTHLVAWNFFGVRKLVWDKWSGDVRVDNLRDDQTVILNINNDKGRVFRKGNELTEPDSVAKYVKQAKSAWINDSYWLFMPFKLKDSGVTLKYLGDEETKEGKPADVLQLTFKNVGNTPDNKYKVWIDKQSHLVSQWAHYPKFTDEQPRFTLPWSDYQQHGGILLSGERGERDITDIMVFTGLPGEVFSDFTRTDFSRYPQAK
ncbi:LolA-like protein [Spirosoma agri]|uniref:Outer membrane lipoprotein-sorting protein n=1 Tax=Spirosoma agri TaxID=1987381 RepID=A0A6M0IGD5_9BACT|nr:outer membrane lipoprotein-sorting protein [Spirosoma agri]NEU67238.1 outer membrane lipoprotein-sorting protein [Spirosoma agri]